MKKLIFGLILSLTAAMAFAIPNPKEIEHALEARDYASAQSMTQQVLREKPESPKAHLYNAYILLKQGNKGGAAAELETASRLDTHGTVRNSALYGRTVAELELAPVRAAPRPQRAEAFQTSAVVTQPTTYITAQEKEGTSFLAKLIIFMLIVLLAYAIYSFVVANKSKPEPVVVRNTYVGSRSGDSSADEYVREPVTRASPRFRQPVYEPAPQVVVQQPVQQQGLGAMGTVASVAGGVVAGNLVSDMLHSGHHSSRSNDDYEERQRRRRREEESTYSPPAYVPDPAPAYQPSYETKASSYSAGSDDSWSSRSSSSSDSGSSWDSGSSSSSDSGSSGGSDW